MVTAVASSSSRSSSSTSQVRFFCQEVGHLRKDCPKRKERIRCYQCEENGHIQRNCPRQTQRKADSVNAVVDRPSQDRCLALQVAARVLLPRIYVDARGCSGRLKAAVDSCSNCSLISVETARSHDIDVMLVNGDCPITAIDGSLLVIIRVAKLTVAQDDEFVYLPEINAEFLVVQSLKAVSADLLIGLDIISANGGVRLTYGEEPGVLTQVTF